jgi:NAD(P)H-dependent FMN reductase
VKILGISGSLSASSANTAVLALAATRLPAPDKLVVHPPLDALPHFNPDHDTDPAPAPVTALRAAVADADAVVVATPEYAGGMPGVLKNALDWLVGSGELFGKRAVVVSAASSRERGAGARQSVESTLTMQGALVCDSFTVVAPGRGRSEHLAAAAAEALARTMQALTSGPGAAGAAP